MVAALEASCQLPCPICRVRPVHSPPYVDDFPPCQRLLGLLSFPGLLWHLSTAVAQSKAVIKLHDAVSLAMTQIPVY